MSALLGQHFRTLIDTEHPDLSRKGRELVLTWAHKVYESPDAPRSAEARGGKRDSTAKTLNDIHRSRLVCRLGREAMAEWLGYGATATLSRALTDAREAGLVFSWYAPTDNHPSNRLIVPAFADEALTQMQALCTAHISEHGLAVPIEGDADLDPATAVAVLTEVARATIPKLGNMTYPHWPVTAYHVTHDLKELTRQHTGVRLPEVAARGPKSAAMPARASAAKLMSVTSAPQRSSKTPPAAALSRRDRVIALAAQREATVRCAA